MTTDEHAIEKMRRRIPEAGDGAQSNRFAIRNNTPAGRAARVPQPVPVHSQAEQRDRRRAGLSVTLDGRWSLVAVGGGRCNL